MAEQAGVSPEEFLHRRVDQLLDRADDEFDKAATYVLEKNAGTLSASRMIRYLSVEQVVDLHARVLAQKRDAFTAWVHSHLKSRPS